MPSLMDFLAKAAVISVYFSNCTSGSVDHPLLGKAERVLGGAQDVHSSGCEAPGKSLHLLSVQQDNVHTSCTFLSEPFCPQVRAFASLSAWNASCTFHHHHSSLINKGSLLLFLLETSQIPPPRGSHPLCFLLC